MKNTIRSVMGHAMIRLMKTWTESRFLWIRGVQQIITMFNSLRCVLSWYILCRELVYFYVENVHLSCVLFISISFWKDVRVIQTVHEAKNNRSRRWFIRCSWLLWLHGIADFPLTHKLIEFEYSRSECAKYLLFIKK
jgi:hypothetical protein